jgi:ubiquinone/menaquinone biosynthesis C-methylase UbiE
METVDYDRVAPGYDRRYRDGGPAELIAFVRARCAEASGGDILEVGCGTGRWLREVAAAGARSIGLDPSAGMLARARENAPSATLVRGRGESLPFTSDRFRAILCIYVIHHLKDPAQFVREAARVLEGGGSLTVVALAPHDGRDAWYLYDYFDGMREADCTRYPTTSSIESWMAAAGLTDVAVDIAGRLTGTARGAAVLDDPILTREGTCQLSLLSDAEFERGMARIREAATRADPASFVTDLRLFATVGRKAGA